MQIGLTNSKEKLAYTRAMDSELFDQVTVTVAMVKKFRLDVVELVDESDEDTENEDMAEREETNDDTENGDE